MSKIDYTALDGAILASIRTRGRATFLVISSLVKKHSEPLAHTSREGMAWRVVDRRLQALRKAGKIKYARKPEGWTLV